jgi:hypothetical protein
MSKNDFAVAAERVNALLTKTIRYSGGRRVVYDVFNV